MTTTACEGQFHKGCNGNCYGRPQWDPDPEWMMNRQPRIGPCDCPCH